MAERRKKQENKTKKENEEEEEGTARWKNKTKLEEDGDMTKEEEG